MTQQKRQKTRWVSFFLAVCMLLTMLSGFPVAFAAEKATFLIGPYLLAPKTNSMVIAWESDQDVQSTIRIGKTEAELGEPITVERDPEAPAYGGQQTNMYRYKCTDLTPGEKYYYEVALGKNGETCKGSFRALEENPEEIRFLSITDTHRFDTKETFSQAVAEYDPAFIIHGGDMVEGTGTQKEQFAFWFGSGDFIHNYPVVYACGNHDFSDYFDMYVIDTQTEEYGSVVPGNIGFDYGDVHFDLMDSNPWALFQMNAETSGGQMDAATGEKITQSVQWLKDDLAANQDKKFRILVMHHPASDPYTKRHIVPVAEEGNVDLLLAGHTHSYARAVSDDPAVGASTVYLTHQDSRAVSKKGSYMTNTIKGDLLTNQNMAQGEVVQTTLIAAEKQKLSYSDISITPDNILANGEITVSAVVKNDGAGLAAVVIPVEDNGVTKYIYGDSLESESGLSTSGEPVKVASNGVKMLEPGESIQMSGTVSLREMGKHTVKVADKTQTVEVAFRPATFVYDNVRTKLGDGEVSDINSDILHIKADVTNIGNEDGTADATLYINDKAIQTQRYTIASEQKKTCEFTYQFEEFGEFQVRIGDSTPVTVVIEGSIQGLPMVKDLSGKGNNGYIHGAPTVGKNDKGTGTILLDGDQDYVEIPDNQNFTVDNGITGMVWAKLPESEGTGIDTLTPNGRDHNPLLTKGVSIGWGTNYLYRMAVRATGKITVGIGFDNDNGEFFWNDDDADDKAGIKKGKWVQYVGGFDRTTGGDSYQNKYHSGHIDAPDFDSEIKNWPGASTYIGFSYTGALLTNRNRGIDRTMLAGEIAQARLYDTKLSEKEVGAICDKPTEKGAKSNNMVLWLDFDSKNIVPTGTHTTEWVKLSGKPSTLAYEAKIEGDDKLASKIEAKIEFSQDGKTASSSKSYDLENGEHTIDLSDAGEGSYARIVTTFTSALGEEASYLPVLNEYVLTAGDTSAAWNTYADWAKGTFADGAGHQSSDVYRALSEDFDDYSGSVDQGTVVEPGTPTPDTTSSSTSDTTPTSPSDSSSASATDTSADSPAIGADVPADHWARDELVSLVKRGILEGDEKGNLNPDSTITRQEFISILLRALHISPVNNAKLDPKDRSSDWAFGILQAAKNIGILQGDEHGYLNGLDTASRAEVVAMIARAANISSTQTSILSRFDDAADVPTWAAAGLAGLVEQGKWAGQDSHSLHIKEPITRAEAFVLLYNIL